MDLAPAHVGCSGWLYRPWRGRFYPADLPTTRWFDYYASKFDTVEINNTFYRLPDHRVFEDWRRQAPEGFIYAIKASRYLTHMKRLIEPAPPLARLRTRLERLGAARGPLLFQLPGSMLPSAPRLDRFLRTLDRMSVALGQAAPGPPVRHSLEVRNPAWYVPEVFDRLRAHDVALCLHDKAGSESPRLSTASFVYVRFHGPTGLYRGAYERAALGDWADWLNTCRRRGTPVYAYFNNDIDAQAPRDAEILRELLG
jgi:uncharacterized protein YecE (DUF72 family)